MSKHERSWNDEENRRGLRQIPPRVSDPVLQLRIHFQKAINAKLSGLGALGGMQGLSSWDMGSDKILARDGSGMLVDFDGRPAFWPWANIAWVQVLESKPAAV